MPRLVSMPSTPRARFNPQQTKGLCLISEMPSLRGLMDDSHFGVVTVTAPCSESHQFTAAGHRAITTANRRHTRCKFGGGRKRRWP